MAKIQSSNNNNNNKYLLCLVCSVILNLLFMTNLYVGSEWIQSWSSRAAKEAEAVAAISCSGHGRAYLDGVLVDGQNQPVCECNTCFSGTDCSLFLSDCDVDADGGDPLFLEPFWMQNAESSALVVAGWHRMSYSYKDGNLISQELETHIRKIHDIIGNAVTHKRFIVFGAGSTQLLNAAVHALSPDNSSSPARVVASIPFYPLYEKQTVYFQSADYKFEGDISVWKNSSDTSMNLIEFVTAPNNPDGQMNKAVLKGPNTKTIHDHAYYWPHYTPITAPADGNLMIFTTSKLTGHAGSRFGWAVIKDESVYQKMNDYMGVNTMGVSRDTQLRALKLLKVVLESGGREIFEFGHNTMRNRWEKLSNTISLSNRFTLQQIPPQYCTFFHKVRASSPAFAWVKCEREEDINCYEVLKAAKIIGRSGRIFQGLDQYVRLSLLRSQDDFDLLIHRLSKLVSEENGAKTM